MNSEEYFFQFKFLTKFTDLLNDYPGMVDNLQQKLAKTQH